MKIIGFNFTKVSAQKQKDFKKGPVNIKLEFLEVTKEKSEVLKEESLFSVNFSFTVEYSSSDSKNSKNLAEINLEGKVLISADKKETEEIDKSWKKKDFVSPFKLSLFNFLFKKSSIKAILLEEDLNLPLHIPFPNLNPSK